MPKIAQKKKKEIYAFWGTYPAELTTPSSALATKFGLTSKEMSSLKGTYHRLVKEGKAKAQQHDVNVITTPPAVATTGAKTTVTTPPVPRGTTENPGVFGQPRGDDVAHVEQTREVMAPPIDPVAPVSVAPADDLQALNAKFDGATKEIATLKAMMGDVLKERTGNAQAQDTAFAKIEIDEGSLVARTLHLTPKTLMLFDIAKADGYPGDLSSYLNDVVTSFYAKRGLSLGLVERREII